MGNNPILRDDPLGDSAPTPAQIKESMARMDALNKPGDNTRGIFHLPSEGEKDLHPLKAAFQTVGYYGLKALGWKATDEAVATLSDSKSSTGDKIIAAGTGI